MTASGLNLLHLVCISPIFLVLAILGICKLRWKWPNAIFRRIKSAFGFNYYVRYNVETFLVYAICTMMTSKSVKFDNWALAL